jgi:branched-chain amino acid transport system ATP-binding protein
VILQVEELVVGYGQSVVVHGISFQVAEGEIASLVGRNGAGKTTTIRGLMGLTRPRASRVIFRGRTITGLAPYEIARLGVGYVPDHRRIFPDLTVEENLRLAARVAARGGPWTLERVYDLFPTLRGLRARRGDHLSGGEQKMLAIGRALIRNPDLILLDDPAEGLAPLVVRRLGKVLREIHATRSPCAGARLAPAGAQIAPVTTDRPRAWRRLRTAASASNSALASACSACTSAVCASVTSSRVPAPAA